MAEARLQPGPADAVREVLWAEGSNLSPEPVGATEEMEIDGPDGPVLLRVYWPLGFDDGPLPTLVYVHGGGWVIADLDAYDSSARALTNRAGCILVSVGYRQAPEHRFPAAHDDVLAATQWVMANIAERSGDPARVAIGGEGAGANMAVATCMSLLRLGAGLPVFQLLVNPVTDLSRRDWPSFAEFASTPPLTTAMVDWFARNAVWGPRDASDPRLSPLQAYAGELERLPPTLVITAENDPLRDQGEAFGLHLVKAGVDATTLRVQRVTHDFLVMNPVVDQAQVAVSLAAEHLRQAWGLKGKAAPATAPDLTQVIAAEHAGVVALFTQVAEGRGNRQRLVEQLVSSLEAHSAMEEEVLYPAIQASGHLDDADAAEADHAHVATLSADLMGADGRTFERVFTQLTEAVLTHAAEEEETLLPALRAAAGATRMRELGHEALAFRRTGPRRLLVSASAPAASAQGA
ncbi:MAG: alpha/beta hydrolase fold domain-containing protein [Acidimicrobiales bacterium]